jgi:hypothetical protein
MGQSYAQLTFTTSIGVRSEDDYDTNMSSATVEMLQNIQSCMDQIVAALRGATGAENLVPGDLTDVLKTAFTQRNRLDSALTGAIGALDRVAERAPHGALTAGLSSVKYGYPAASLA